MFYTRWPPPTLVSLKEPLVSRKELLVSLKEFLVSLKEALVSLGGHQICQILNIFLESPIPSRHYIAPSCYVGKKCFFTKIPNFHLASWPRPVLFSFGL